MKTKLLFVIPFIIFSFQTKTINAQGWSTVGGWLEDTSNGTNVNALAVYNGELYIGGFAGTGFNIAGGVPVNNIARWNGITWDSVGAGIGGNSNTVNCMTVYNGELYVGGGFTMAGGVPANNIAKWDGINWASLGTGVNSFVQSLIVHNGELYVGGGFTTAGGMPAMRVAKWNGTNWASVGTGLNGTIQRFVSYNGELYSGGSFTSNFSFPVNRIARWNGAAWDSVRAGMNNSVLALSVYNGELYAGGQFTTAGGVPVNKIARWNGTVWDSVPGANFTDRVWDLVVYNGNLYASVWSPHRLAEWDGTSWWSPVCTTFNNRTRDLAVYNGELYVVGEFNSVGSLFSPHIARWSPPNANVTGNIIVCSGSPVTLTANNGNYIYEWYNNNVLMAGETNQQLTVTTPGNYSVVTSVINQSCAGTATSVPVAVVLGTGPTNLVITSSSATGCQPNTIYTGYGAQSITLTASATGAVSFFWSTGATTQSISVTTAGTYSVTAYDASGCASAATPETETIISVLDARCGNDKKKIMLCHVPDGNPANRQTICIAPTAVAAHLALHSGDCIGSCASSQREITSAEEEENEIVIEPNPATNELRIKNAELRIENVEVHDLLGKVVVSAQPVTSNPKQETTINVSTLLPGIYFVTVTDKNKNSITRKIVKM